jgi:hypothetical protein
MESAALTKAHEHVRTAATATFDNRVATAGQEHDLAATAFHEAVQDTHNREVRIYYRYCFKRADTGRRCASSASSKTTTASSPA